MMTLKDARVVLMPGTDRIISVLIPFKREVCHCGCRGEMVMGVGVTEGMSATYSFEMGGVAFDLLSLADVTIGAKVLGK